MKCTVSRFAQFAVLALAVAVGLILFKAPAQDSPAGAPSVTAIAKGPDQINLVWPELRGSHYGYLVEIQSDDDPRYTQWSELQPIPKASGYTCDSSIVHQGSPCKTSDPEGVHVYNPATNGVPQWVTDTNYTDPQDDSPAQFISWGLRQNTIYRFRVRTYTGQSNIQYGPYSSAAVATTAQAALRYVSPTGNDDNDGTAPDDAHAWRTLSHGAARIACGQEMIVMGGDYANDAVTMQQTCSAGGKAVVMVNPGDTATITSMAAANAWHPILLLGSHLVIDGLRVVSATPAGDYDVQIDGSYNALLNLDIHPPVIPSFKGGVNVLGSHNLIYRSALRDYGSPDSLQNPNGDNGFVLVFQGKDATGNVSWSNHLTRGGHDVTLCKAGCRFNRFLNNVMDGGWGMGFENVFGDGLGSDHNLI